MARHSSENSARARIRAYMDSLELPAVFTSQEIRRISGIDQFARRLRELRQEEGYLILGYKDQTDLKQDEYRLLGKEASRPTKRKAPAAELRQSLKQIPYCQLCGRADGALVPGSTYRRVKLGVHHISPKARAGGDGAENLMVLCTYCNEGLSDLTAISSFRAAEDLLPLVRESGRKLRTEAYRALVAWQRHNPT